jgi:predicted acyl esterase
MASRVLIDKDVPMTTRDGVTLRADVYRPDAPGRFPVLLSRLPYDKNLRRRPGDIDVFVDRGYVVIMQDISGRPVTCSCLVIASGSRSRPATSRVSIAT